ncbi:MAG: zeta toxin family protein [Endomicrobiaceae bacterium]|nr:zeta toxin family protein [Endomicrobiaceae bacterium]
MQIILLSGKPHTGKTSTLNIVFDQLKPNTPKISLDGDDFKCVFQHTNKKGITKNIAIYSIGDFIRNCIEAIIEYSGLNVDILILAYSDKRKKLNLHHMINKFQQHTVVTKTVNTQDNSIANKQDATRIINLL